MRISSKRGSDNPQLSSAENEVERLCSTGNLPAANQKFRLLLQNGLRVDQSIYDQLILKNIKAGDVASAYQAFKKGIKGQVVTEHCAALYKQLVKEGVLAAALRVLKTINEHNKYVPIGAHSSLVACLCEEKKSLNLTLPDIYNSMIRQFTEVRDAKGAEEAFSETSNPDQESYNLLLRAYARSVKFIHLGVALAAYNRAKSRDEKSYLYTMAHKALQEAEAKAGVIEGRMKVIRDEMRSKGFLDDIETCNAFIELYNRIKKPELAAKEFNDLKSYSLKPNAATLYSMIHLHIQFAKRAGVPSKKLELENALKMLDLFCMDSLLVQEEPLVKCYSGKKLLLKGFSAVLGAYKELIKNKAASKEDKGFYLKKMFDLFEQMKKMVEPNEVAYSILIEACIRVGEPEQRVEALLQEMQGLDPTTCYHILIQTCMDIGLEGRAIELYERFGIQPYQKQTENGATIIDFHNCSRGVAYIQLLKHIQTKPRFPFEIIPGKGKHSKNNETTMLNYLKIQMREREEFRDYYCRKGSNGGTLIIGKRR